VRGGRIVGLVLAGILALGVIGLVVLPRVGSHDRALTVVRALVSSEKQPLLTDPDVTAELARAGYRLQVDTAGSREIATSRDLGGYDLAFPADSTQADRIKRDKKITRSYVPFFSPMAIATFRPIADLLTAAGVVRHGTSLFDMKAYLGLVNAETRWSQLPGNTAYRTDKSVLISSTDVRTSNSAALYLAIASYVANGDNVVSTAADADTIADRLAPLFLKQGYLDASTLDPFGDFLSIGIGKTPMVMIYEAQFAARALAKDGSITGEMVLLYPSPTIYAKHTVVPLTDRGDAVGRLLSTNPVLQHLAVRFGFRTSDAAYLRSSAAARGVPPPAQIVNVVEPPTQEISERMIRKIEAKY
jgi:hypothetical protein